MERDPRCRRTGTPPCGRARPHAPDSDVAQQRALVDRYAAGEPGGRCGRDYFQSLRAAFTLDEIRDQLHAVGLDHFAVDAVSDRHVVVAAASEGSDGGEAEVGVDLARRGRAVQRVEVQARRAAVEQRVGTSFVASSIPTRAPPPGSSSTACSLSASHAGNSEPCICDIRLMPPMLVHRHDPGDHRLVDAEPRAATRRGRSSGRASKKNCVIAKSAAPSFSAVCWRSASRLGERGCGSGCAATPIEKSPSVADELDELDRVVELALGQVEVGAAGRRRRARMFSMPASP